jgi:hypothetical protein
MVDHHHRWTDALHAARDADVNSPHVSCRNREATRFIAVSQCGASGFLDIEPDGTARTRIAGAAFVKALQRRGSLCISAATAAFDTLERLGHRVDRKGDGLCNGGEYNRRHNATARAQADMLSAGATGAIILGDKERPELTEMINETCIVDVAELGGDPDTGGDLSVECKVPSAMRAEYQAGGGAGGTWASVGHLYGFGSTGEKYAEIVMGCRARGRPADMTFDHTTGRGYVKARDGSYRDALVVKKGTVVLGLVEATGGIHPSLDRLILARDERAKGRSAIDRTRYGLSRVSTKSFKKHHRQMISKTAVVEDAMAIGRQVIALKQQAANVAAAAGVATRG